MRELFAEILNISISAGILIIVCVLVRLLFKKMPKFVRCLMWLLVAIRLAIPFAIESPLSLLPAREYVTVSSNGIVSTDEAGSTFNNNEVTDKADVADNTETIDSADTINRTEAVNSTGLKSFLGSIDVMYVLSIVWIAGVVAVLIYALVAYIRLRRLVDDAVLLRDNIYQSERAGTAFILGVIRPKIYVPYGLSSNELYMSIIHERSHISRRDHLVKPLGFIIAAVYWFNPLVWLAYVLLCRDIELACDEKVIKKIGYDKKKDYSQALLNLSIPRKYISACPVAFGEVGINERIKNVLTMKKGKKIIIAVAVAICAVLAICFLTYPKMPKNNSGEVAGVQASEETAESKAEDVDVATNDESVNDVVSEDITIKEDTGEEKDVKINITGISDIVIGNGIITRQFSEEHQGVDISAEEGTAVVSIYDGSVEEIGSNEDEGNYIIIKNDKGCTLKYSHLKEASNVSEGDRVNAGTEVGKVGSTGKSTGPHVHIEIMDEQGKLVDPMNFNEYR